MMGDFCIRYNLDGVEHRDEFQIQGENEITRPVMEHAGDLVRAWDEAYHARVELIGGAVQIEVM